MEAAGARAGASKGTLGLHHPRLSEAHGEANQERAVWATLAWATGHAAVKGLVVADAADYEDRTGLRAPAGRLRPWWAPLAARPATCAKPRRRRQAPTRHDRMFSGFSPAAMTFLRDLARHNQRQWFEEHRDVYERDLREPLRALIEEMDVRLATAAPELVGDPKRSPFRIHRDVRFSKDQIALQDQRRLSGSPTGRRPRGTEIHGGAGFYFHLEPRASFIAVGIWMPAPRLAKLRRRDRRRPPGFKKNPHPPPPQLRPTERGKPCWRPHAATPTPTPRRKVAPLQIFTASRRPLLVRDLRSSASPTPHAPLRRRDPLRALAQLGVGFRPAARR